MANGNLYLVAETEAIINGVPTATRFKVYKSTTDGTSWVLQDDIEPGPGPFPPEVLFNEFYRSSACVTHGPRYIYVGFISPDSTIATFCLKSFDTTSDKWGEFHQGPTCGVTTDGVINHLNTDQRYIRMVLLSDRLRCIYTNGFPEDLYSRTYFADLIFADPSNPVVPARPPGVQPPPAPWANVNTVIYTFADFRKLALPIICFLGKNDAIHVWFTDAKGWPVVFGPNSPAPTPNGTQLYHIRVSASGSPGAATVVTTETGPTSSTVGLGALWGDKVVVPYLTSFATGKLAVGVPESTPLFSTELVSANGPGFDSSLEFNRSAVVVDSAGRLHFFWHDSGFPFNKIWHNWNDGSGWDQDIQVYDSTPSGAGTRNLGVEVTGTAGECVDFGILFDQDGGVFPGAGGTPSDTMHFISYRWCHPAPMFPELIGP